MPPIGVHELLLKEEALEQKKQQQQQQGIQAQGGVSSTLQDDLTRSVRRGDLDRVRYLCEYTKVAVSHRDRFGATPLYYACLCGHVDVVRFLLSNGAKAEERTFDGERAYYAALTDEIRHVLKCEGFNRQIARGHDLFLSALERLWTGDPSHVSDPSLFADLLVATKTKQKQKAADLAHKREEKESLRPEMTRDGAAGTRASIRWGSGDESIQVVKQVHMFVLKARCPRLASFLEKRSFVGTSTCTSIKQVIIPCPYLPVVLCVLEWIYTNRWEIPLDVLMSDSSVDFLRKIKLDDDSFEDLMKEHGRSASHSKSGHHKHNNRFIVIEPSSNASRLRMQAALAPFAQQSWCKSNEEGTLCDIHKHLDFCDVLLVAEGGQHACHKSLLCVRSEYFKHMFTGCFVESNCHVQRVELTGVESQTLEVFLHWVYVDELIQHESIEMLFSVLLLADQFLCEGLKALIANVLSEHVDEENCLDLLSLSTSTQCERLYDRCLLTVARNLLLPIVRNNPLLCMLVEESASEIEERQDVDTIGLVDDLRYVIEHLSRDSSLEHKETTFLKVKDVSETLDEACLVEKGKKMDVLDEILRKLNLA